MAELGSSSPATAKAKKRPDAEGKRTAAAGNTFIAVFVHGRRLRALPFV
jgi:hypothetical protein